MPRPRGGDWLEDEVNAWRLAGVDLIVSLLTSDEVTDFDLDQEREWCQSQGIQFRSFPIVDRSVPSSRSEFAELVVELANRLKEGTNVAIHCRQGIGRAALVAICVLIQSGMDVDEARERVSQARGCPVPETSEQRRWIADFVRKPLVPQST
jgi:protein-tyrosine phosphatase